MNEDEPRAEAHRLESRRVYDGRVIDVTLDHVRLPNGHLADLEMIRHPGAAAVLPFLPDGRVILIRQYRWAAEQWILEVPAGKLDPGEAPEECARRETREEAGYEPGALHALGAIYTTPGFTDEIIHLFAATALTEAGQELEADEVIEVLHLPLDEALGLAAEGRIIDGKSLCTLFRAEQEIRAGRLVIA